jgi:hypothetical protein
MKNQSHINDLLRAQKVLESCDSKEHVDAAIRYFRLFINKWKHLFSVNVVKDLEMNFTIDVAKKLKQIKLR